MEDGVIDCHCPQERQEKWMLDKRIDGCHRYGCRCKISKITESFVGNKGAS